MLEVLDEKVKTSCYDMAYRYPNCRYLYIIDNLDSLMEHQGYLYCVSSSDESFSELVDAECRLREQGILCVHAGSYNNGGGVGVQYEVDESKI